MHVLHGLLQVGSLNPGTRSAVGGWADVTGGDPANLTDSIYLCSRSDSDLERWVALAGGTAWWALTQHETVGKHALVGHQVAARPAFPIISVCLPPLLLNPQHLRKLK